MASGMGSFRRTNIDTAAWLFAVRTGRSRRRSRPAGRRSKGGSHQSPPRFPLDLNEAASGIQGKFQHAACHLPDGHFPDVRRASRNRIAISRRALPSEYMMRGAVIIPAPSFRVMGRRARPWRHGLGFCTCLQNASSQATGLRGHQHRCLHRPHRGTIRCLACWLCVALRGEEAVHARQSEPRAAGRK